MMKRNSVDCRESHPSESASFLSNLFYTWTLPIFAEGNQRDLTVDDLYKPLTSHRSHILGNKLEAAWRQQIKTNQNSFARALWNVFKKEICAYTLMNFMLVFIPKLCQPIILMQILNYYIPGQTQISQKEASCYVAALILLLCISSISDHTYIMGMQQLGIKLRVAASSLMYRKTLRLSKFALNDTSTGQIITLMSNDVMIFDNVMLKFSLLVTAPSELIADTILLYFLLGKTAIIGIVFLLLFIPLQMYNGKLAANYRFKTARKTDQRILLMNEIISGIQVIKMYTWEKPFAKLVKTARRLEVKQIRGAAYVNSFIYSYGMYMSRTAQFISIIAYVLSGHTPVAQYVFVLTSLYNNLTNKMSVKFPEAISIVAKFKISCSRIEKFLSLDEVKYPPRSLHVNEIKEVKSSSVEKPKVMLKISNITVRWSASDTVDILCGIDLEVKSKDKIAIVGPVGSGKSSLINVMLQELPVVQGFVKINGTISYSSQEPWLFRESIRQNILFGQPEDSAKYKEIVEACALQKDFEMFPSGDLSMVGEKGVMLSGGQKARINLARAIYRDADIYLLDDPLSAVDTHVGKQLYDKCIRGYLSEKCVILITHQLQYLKTMDRVYLMENGSILQSGSSEHLNSDSQSNILERTLSYCSESDGGENRDANTTESREENEKNIGTDNSSEFRETMSTGAMSKQVYKRYFQSGGKWYVYVPVFTLFFATQMCASFADYFITFWVNLEQSKSSMGNRTNYEATTRPSKNFLGQPYAHYQSLFSSQLCIYIYSSIICILILIALCRSIAFFQYCLTASTRLHNNMFEVISRAPMRFFNINPSGRILNRFTKDIGSIDERLPMLLLGSIQIGITVIAVSIILTSINPWMLIPTFVILILFYSYKHYYIKTSRSIKRMEGTVRSPIFSHITASLQGLSTIRAFNIQDVLIEEFDRHQDLHSSAYYLFLSCNRAFGILLDLNCLIYVTIVTVSTFFTATFGGFVGLSITQAMGLTGRMQIGVRQWSETENQMTSVERILEYSNIEPEKDTDKEPSQYWPEKGAIDFELVSMRYSPNEPSILKKLTFRIIAKEKIGIVGRTGAGKSSIIAAIFRLTPTEGKILIDGVNIGEISLTSLRSKISIIPQEPFLFSGTLRKNLDPFDEFNDESIWNALKEVELRNIVEDSPQGLNYQVSEGGSNFSVGQRQLICLARALIRKNRILIMDEATANVDPKTDEFIQSTIRSNFKDCTVLTIAHRLHSIMDSDKVLVMEAGCLVEFERPYVLLENGRGVFHDLVMETGKGISDNLKKMAKESYEKIHDVTG